MREKISFECAEANTELGEVEEGAERRRGTWNKAEEARGAPMAGGVAVRAGRRRDSERETEKRRTEWRGEWRGRWRCQWAEGGRGVGERACWPRGAAGWAGWLAPARQ